MEYVIWVSRIDWSTLRSRTIGGELGASNVVGGPAKRGAGGAKEEGSKSSLSTNCGSTPKNGEAVDVCCWYGFELGCWAAR